MKPFNTGYSGDDEQLKVIAADKIINNFNLILEI